MQPQQRAIPKLPTSALEVEARGGPPILIDPRRNSFAGILIGGAFEFLVAHELAHIRNGHVDLMKEMGATGLEDSSRPRPAPALTAQTLEMDADCGAIVRTVNRALDLSDRFSGVPEDRRWMFFDALGTYERATLTVMMSAYAVFRLFDESYWCERDLECRKHPPAPIRQIMTLATAAEHLKRHEQPGLSERFADLAGQAVETIERACALMLGQTELAVNGLRGARSAQSERHARGLLAHWKELRPRLEHLKRGGTLAD